MENEIKNALDRINEAQRDTTLNRLEDVLRDVLDTIARQDRRRLRLHTATKRKKSKRSRSKKMAQANQVVTSQINQVQVEQGPAFSGQTGPFSSDQLISSVDTGEKLLQTGNEWYLSDDSGAENGVSELNAISPPHDGEVRPAAPVPGPEDEIKFSYEVARTETTPRQPKRRRNSFDIQFFDIPPDADGQVKRSYLVDATIYINVAHPDFQERMVYNRQGQPKVTERLGAYIAATVSIHYKDQFYSQYGYIPERRDLLFDEQVDFIFRLEAALREHLPALERELVQQKKAKNSA